MMLSSQEAERIAVHYLSSQLHEEKKNFIFAIGGSIPTVPLPSQLICKSNGIGSKIGIVPAAQSLA
jgi:hypothetical protein